MKRIGEYRKLFGVEENTDLKGLKTSYRNLVKEWHPDKFREGDEKAAEAELMSRKIIEGYKFLVSISPETNSPPRKQALPITCTKDFYSKSPLETETCTSFLVFQETCSSSSITPTSKYVLPSAIFSVRTSIVWLSKRMITKSRKNV